jgi:UDP-GlcNAc:undecaprenyl-phosphate GlcNAc-1-phosphate transferase
MQTYLPIILAAFFLAFLATPLTRILAQRVGMIDQPGVRKAHRSPVPLLGGLAMYVAIAIAIFAFAGRDWLWESAGIFVGMTMLFATGLWDDRYGAPVWVKFAAQLGAALAIVIVGVRVQLIHPILDVLITIVWVVGITNAVNFMDNMDGLAAGISAVAAGGFFVLAALEGQGLVASLAAALCGAALGFLFYNFAPAVSFMGDAGALTLGFLLAVLGIKIRFLDFSVASTWMSPIVVLGVLIFDTTLVTISRLRRGRSPFQGGSDHTSHRLAQLGLSSPRAVLTLYVTAAALSALAVWMVRLPPVLANGVFGALVVVGVAALVVFERIEPKLSGDPLIVVIPAGDGAVDAVRAARELSREVVVLLAPREINGEVQPARWEVIELITLLADDPTTMRALLERGLSDSWWRDLNRLNGVLRITGMIVALTEQPVEQLPAPDQSFTLAGPTPPEALNALRKARLVLLGPGDPNVNLIPALLAPGVRETLPTARGPRLWAGSTEKLAALMAWVTDVITPIPATHLPATLQKRLLHEAAGHSKTAEK